MKIGSAVLTIIFPIKMINLQTIKIMLTTAGISRLKIDFDEEQKHVNADYIFRGVPGNKQITYQEIIDSLSIGPAEAPAHTVVDDFRELR